MQIKLRKGFDISLKGKAKNSIVENLQSDTYSFKPSDFARIDRPKLLVNEGDTVKAGTPIFFDKKNPAVQFTAPVSGEIVHIERGAKRFPNEIRILADKEIAYESFPKYDASDINSLSPDRIKELMLKSGVWANMVERPFGYIPSPEHQPKSIFISAFDSHPLAPDYEFVFKGEEKYLQAGLDAISSIQGNIHLSVRAGKPSLFKSLKGVKVHEISGPHPAGNVGVQIHHIDPIGRDEFVWTITPYGLQQIGRLFLDGRYDSRKIVALTGSEVKSPQYYDTYMGVPVAKLVQDNLSNDHVRIISGNVLTGRKIAPESSLGFYDNQFTIIPEGDHHEFLGWILPSSKKLSFQRAFGLLSFLSPKKERVLDSNMHGEERAFVQTGIFEQVVPMDIYPGYLIKSILAGDIEEMEALGIYEVIEEDFALCEFVDVSKMQIQKILRKGIEEIQEA